MTENRSTASPGHITVFKGLKTHFQQQGMRSTGLVCRL